MKSALLLPFLALAVAAAPASRSHSATVKTGQPHEASFTFRAVGVYPSSQEGFARVRVSPDGTTWGDWIDARQEHSDSGALVFLDNPARWIEVDRPARVLFIDPGESTPLPQAKTSPPKRDALTAPVFVNRAEWGCSPERCSFRGGQPIYSTVTHLVVHHTAGSNSSTDWAAVMRSIWELHVNGNRWSDIGYNWLIDPNGVLYEGRQGGDGVIGAHFSGVNTNTMGVSLMGTFTALAPPLRMVETLTTLLSYYAQKYKLDALGESLHAPSRLRLNVISGHRDAGLSQQASGTTECPGNGVYVLLPAVRTGIAARAAEACPVSLKSTSFCLGPEASSLDPGLNTPAGCPSSVSLADTSWISTGSAGTLQIEANATSSRRSATVNLAGRPVLITQAAAGAPTMPCVAARGILTAGALDAKPVVAGSLITLYGSALASQATATTAFPLPTTLGGVSVTVNGNRALPLLYAGPDQIFAQIPPGTQTGSARLVVTRDGNNPSPEVLFWITEASPVLLAPESSVVRAGTPLVVYLTGGGTVTGGFPASGNAAPLDRTLPVSQPWSAALGGRSPERLYLGLTPGSIGLYQANLMVPADLPAGSYPLTLTIAGATSAALEITVQ